MDLGLKDKVAVITGTGSQIGFGHAISLVLAQEGCDVVGVDIDGEGAEKTAAAVKALGREALAFKTDITNRAEVDVVVNKTLEKFKKIDILVNNAGLSVPWKSILEMPISSIEKAMAVNFYGQVNMVQAIVPHMIASTARSSTSPADRVAPLMSPTVPQRAPSTHGRFRCREKWHPRVCS